MNDLMKLRDEIDEIDKELMRLFERRMRVSQGVANYKKERELPIYQPHREKEVIEHNISRLKNKTLEPYAKEFLQSMMTISKRYQAKFYHKEFGLLGETLQHSYSKTIHELLFHQLAFPGKYTLFQKETTEIEGFIEAIRNKKIAGINVTIPYKEIIIPYLDEVSEEVKAIGACNTIKEVDGKLIGYNTDYVGFIHLLKRNTINVTDKKIVVVGAGGASKAVVAYLIKKTTTIVVVSNENSKNLQEIKKQFPMINIVTYKENEKLHGDIIINCTPVGMYPMIDSSIVNEEIVSRFKVAIDLIYNPSMTLFLQYAKNNGLQYVNGLDMLIDQAIEAERIWNDITINEEVRNEIYQSLKRKQS